MTRLVSRTSTAARKSEPAERTQWGEEQAFRVWGRDPAYDEDQQPWKCLAAFKYLQECIDYVRYCNDRGSDVLFQSPGDDPKWYLANKESTV